MASDHDHRAVHEDHLAELRALVRMQREDNRHECGQSALDLIVMRMAHSLGSALVSAGIEPPEGWDLG